MTFSLVLTIKESRVSGYNAGMEEDISCKIIPTCYDRLPSTTRVPDWHIYNQIKRELTMEVL